jgi:hypothetical protein
VRILVHCKLHRPRRAATIPTMSKDHLLRPGLFREHIKVNSLCLLSRALGQIALDRFWLDVESRSR